MISGLVSGVLIGKPQKRQSTKGKPFVTAKLRATGASGESTYIDIIAFSQSAAGALLAMGGGDSLAVSGPITTKVWNNKNGETKVALDIVAAGVMTPYQLTKKREGLTKASATAVPSDRSGQPSDLDDIPF
jgi:single-stranded DNA-binding protein